MSVWSWQPAARYGVERNGQRASRVGYTEGLFWDHGGGSVGAQLPAPVSRLIMFRVGTRERERERERERVDQVCVCVYIYIYIYVCVCARKRTRVCVFE